MYVFFSFWCFWYRILFRTIYFIIIIYIIAKSSEKNERTTIVVENPVFGKVLYRQIAGAVARRIVNYAKTKQTVVQGTDAGFIKFGSRVDLFLPSDTKIDIKLNQKVRGGETVIAKL